MPDHVLVKVGMINLTIDFTLEIGYFLGPLVHQQKNENDLGMIHPNRFRDFLKQDGFADTRRGDNQSTLAVAERREEINSPPADRIRPWIFAPDPPLRQLRR